ncbi:MAG: hypothetical protein KGY70_02290 [Bacteroidales bacterium]|nr:hypothetical protein [Bacteroidales bacterium]
MRRSIFTLILFGLVFSLPTSAQENSSSVEKLRDLIQKDYFTLNLLLQNEGRFSFKDDDFQGGRTFSTPNARISLKGKIDGGFFYRFYLDAAPEPTLLDAYIGYKLHDALSISVGSMKPRQTLDYIPSPADHNFVDRATMTGLLVGSREIGISATGDIEGFYYYTGLFNGNRLSTNNNNKFYGIGRIQYTVDNSILSNLQFAVSGSHGYSEGTVSGSSGPLLRGKRTIIGSDVEVEWDRLYFAAEYLQGELETYDIRGAKEIISGYYLTGGVHLNDKVMTLARWQSWWYKEQKTTEQKLTFGTNVDFTDITGLTLNIDAYMPNQGDTELGASFILQVVF